MSKTPPKPLPYFIDYAALYQKAEAISHAYRSGNLVFFLGAGASKSFNFKFPNWPELLSTLRTEVTIERAEDREEVNRLIKAGKYLLAAEAIKRFAKVDRDDRDEAVDRKVAGILGRQPLTEGDPILQLAILDFSSPIVTTNFDTILEQTLRKNDLDGSYPVFTYTDDRNITQRLDPTEEHSRYIFKLHGGIQTGGLILDEGDYASLYFHERWPRALALLRHILATKMVVFIGFSLSDPEIMPILREATRYAGSYQHIAFLKSSDVSRIEQDSLRSYYRVEPILYQQHTELPLFVMEMRNFNPREELTLKLQPKKDILLSTLKDLIYSYDLDSDCSIIIFGSCVKYGDMASDTADLDVLLINPRETDLKKIDLGEKIPGLDRRLDITVISRLDFEERLRQGDAFTSSILVTGCPIADPYGTFSILARGFRAAYNERDVAANALERCRMRWLRLCALEVIGKQPDFRRACLQWTLSFMQLVIIHRKSPTTLLEASLLGNARYVIHEFVHKLDSSEEAYFLDLLRAAKGLPVDRPDDWPTIREVTGKLASAIGEMDSYEEKELVASSGKLAALPLDKVIQLRNSISSTLREAQSDDLQDSLPGQMEEDLFGDLKRSPLYHDLHTYDWLLFFQLTEITNTQYADKDAYNAAIEKFRAEWE